MKLFSQIPFILCFLLSFLSKGQTSLFYDKYYKVGYNDAITTNVLQLEDTSYVFLNYVKDSATGRQDLNILKTDKMGNQLNIKTHNFGFDYLAYFLGLEHFYNATNSSIFISASTYTSSFSTVIINKINKQTLDTIKNTFYNDGIYNYYLSNFVKINNNKFFLVGNKFDAVNYWPVYLEIDSNIIIKNIITSANTPSVSVRSAFYNTINKKIILSGSKPVGSNFYSFISIADTLGNISNTYVNNFFDNSIAKVLYSPFDNTYITIGDKKTSIYGGNNMYRLYVCKYDVNLNPLWQRTYGHANIVNSFYDAAINSDGSVVLVGRFSDSVANPLTNINCNAVMLKIRSNGDSLWMKQFDSLNNIMGPNNNWYESFLGIKKTPEGGYIMCGNAQQMPKAKAWVVKTDSLGCDLASCMPTNISETKNSISIVNAFPNPVSNVLYIKANQTLENYDIEISNYLGQTSLKLPYSNTVEVSKLSQGFYNLKIISQNKQVYYSKFIKE